MITRVSDCSGVGWMAALVSLNEMRAGPRFKRGEGVAGACSDGEHTYTTHTHSHSVTCRVYGKFLCRGAGVVQAVLHQ